jgi:hypothetical protein
MQLTRRQLAMALTVGPAAAALPAGAAEQSAADELAAARQRVKANGDAMAAIAVPMALEPAFQFKA